MCVLQSVHHGIWIVTLRIIISADFAWGCFPRPDNFCGFVQSVGDDFDWTLNNLQTPTGGTGPDTDFGSHDGKGKQQWCQVTFFTINN